MSEAFLDVEPRTDLSKKETKQLRRSGRVPAVYYIHGEKSIPLSVDEKELRTAVHSSHSIIDLALSKDKKMKTVIRDIHWHPVNNHPLHVDFMGVKMTETLTVDLALHVVGNPIGVKNEGGILTQQLREISIECLPGDIPEHFEIDVSDLALGDSIHVSDLSIDKVKILTDLEQSIVAVSLPTVVAEPEVEEEVEEGAEPELVGEEKDKEEGEETSEES